MGITDSVNYIRYGDGGCFTTATRKDAIGVAFKSVAYNLVGHEDIEDAVSAYKQELITNGLDDEHSGGSKAASEKQIDEAADSLLESITVK